MIYYLYGEDFKKAKEHLHKMTESLAAKKPDAELFRLDSENWSEAQFEELALGQGLFEKKYIVILDGLFEKKEVKSFILDRLSGLASSESIFIFLEKKTDKPTLSKIEKNAVKVQEFALKEKAGRNFAMEGGSFGLGDFNIFGMADAFGRRDKKSLWVLQQKAAARNIPAEEIHGILFWQLKSMMLALYSKNAEESGMKPFVWSKSKGFAGNYSEDELKKISSELVSMYHEAHRGTLDFNVSLEKFILGL